MKKSFAHRIILRKYRLSDAAGIFSWRNDKETTKYMGKKFRNITTLKKTRDSLHKVMRSKSNDSAYYVIADKKTDAYIGGIDLTSIDRIDKVGILSIVIGNNEDRNKGIGTEAITLLLRKAFKDLKLHKIELNVDEENMAAIKCYQKCGFLIEGELRGHSIVDGKYHNLITMGILAADYSRGE